MPLPIALAVIGFGLVEVIISVVVQRKLSNPKRARELQAKMKRLSKELQELGSNASKEALTAKQNEIMALMKENMGMMIKPMLVALPLFLILYYVVLPAGFNRFADETFTFIVPLTYTGLFFVTVLIFGIVSSIIITIYDRKKMQEEALVPEKQQ
jgi:membrane protein insertase Oxa1/YidC/SpoIIIJ